MSAEVFDTVGVGFGPANIALAVAHAESGSNHSLAFFEANATPAWQPGMLLAGSDIQHNPLRDFITPRNPCSSYGYLNYLKSRNRLFHFLNVDSPYPPRTDYAQYVQWVADHFSGLVHYSEKVIEVSLSDEVDPQRGRNLIHVNTEQGTYRARSLSFAPGRSNNIPPVFQPHLGTRAFHFTDYAYRRDEWRRGGAPSSVAVVGASQSAVEIILDLHAALPGTAVHSVFRTFSYVLKDTSPFTEDLLLPSFTDYFYGVPAQSKRQLNEQVLRSNYGSADHDVIKKLYFLLYENEVREDSSITVRNNTRISQVLTQDDGMKLLLQDVHTHEAESLHVDAVILATGFRNFGRAENEELHHPLLAGVVDNYAVDQDGVPLITRSYQLVPANDRPSAPPIFLNGLCEHSHGLGDAGSFSLLSYRAAEMERALANALDTAPDTAAASLPPGD
ncbi:SidA/IucD/PvdA family monooxygenase [Streptomyces sp. NPDC057638]|uniref:SidA/IucD/PvdA family monooxygenase n=1 Tax=Streptomyces sp. NPDC057638 TaxID=3346190 RepID=UPI0036A1A25B